MHQGSHLRQSNKNCCLARCNLLGQNFHRNRQQYYSSSAARLRSYLKYSLTTCASSMGSNCGFQQVDSFRFGGLVESD